MLSAQPNFFSPQPGHELLKRFVGSWRFEKWSEPEEDAKSQDLGTGTVRGEALGAFYVICHWSGTVYDAPFKALQTLGYDMELEKWSGSWVDTLMNYRWNFLGNLEEDDLIFIATGPGPTGGEATFRERFCFHSTDHITIKAEMEQDGVWSPFMTTKLFRVD